MLQASNGTPIQTPDPYTEPRTESGELTLYSDQSIIDVLLNPYEEDTP